jgi:hypothetical protein
VRQGVGDLPHLDRIEGLAQHQHPVAGLGHGDQIVEGVVGVGGADHQVDVGVGAEDAAAGLGAVPARRHAHVDEDDAEGRLLRQRRGDQREPGVPLERRLELVGRLLGRGGPEDPRLERAGRGSA